MNDRQINQCDGCRRGLPMRGNNHVDPEADYDMIGCTAHLYGFPPGKGVPRQGVAKRAPRALMGKCPCSKCSGDEAPGRPTLNVTPVRVPRLPAEEQEVMD